MSPVSEADVEVLIGLISEAIDGRARSSTSYGIEFDTKIARGLLASGRVTVSPS